MKLPGSIKMPDAISDKMSNNTYMYIIILIFIILISSISSIFIRIMRDTAEAQVQSRAQNNPVIKMINKTKQWRVMSRDNKFIPRSDISLVFVLEILSNNNMYFDGYMALADGRQMRDGPPNRQRNFKYTIDGNAIIMKKNDGDIIITAENNNTNLFWINKITKEVTILERY
jgi:hypothetical protein